MPHHLIPTIMSKCHQFACALLFVSLIVEISNFALPSTGFHNSARGCRTSMVLCTSLVKGLDFITSFETMLASISDKSKGALKLKNVMLSGVCLKTTYFLYTAVKNIDNFGVHVIQRLVLKALTSNGDCIQAKSSQTMKNSTNT